MASSAETISPRKIRMLVVGGAAGMGRWMIQHVFSKQIDLEITICDVDEQTGKKAAELSIRGIKIGYNQNELIGSINVQDYDIVMIAVPIGQTASTIQTFAPRMKEGSLLTDVTSIKVMPIAQMTEHAPKSVSIIGTHPMFGPSTESIAGQNLIFVPIFNHCTSIWASWLREIFETNGAHVVESTPEEHDFMMACTQVLMHFLHIAVGKTLLSLHRSNDNPYKIDKA